LVELGYGFAYRVLDAQHFGVPQRRRRVFVVACLGDWRAAAEVLSLREGLRGYLETGNKKRKSPASDAGASVEADGAGVATPFRKSKRACSETDHETWVPADASNTLNNFDLEDTRTTHAVVEPIPLDSMCLLGRENKDDPRRGFGVGKEGDPMFTVTKAHHHGVATIVSRFGTGGGNVPLVNNEPQVACFKSGQGAQARSIGWSESVSPTLPSNAGGNTAPAVIGLNPPMAVRRLTPVECERLQGFPDNWSRISWKGKPEEECPDGPRYKACGNSMAVPVMAFIGKRIAEVEAKGHQS
jgi:DNA (cytosine-5)-methyltransferase 1